MHRLAIAVLTLSFPGAVFAGQELPKKFKLECTLVDYTGSAGVKTHTFVNSIMMGESQNPDSKGRLVSYLHQKQVALLGGMYVKITGSFEADVHVSSTESEIKLFNVYQSASLNAVSRGFPAHGFAPRREIVISAGVGGEPAFFREHGAQITLTNDTGIPITSNQCAIVGEF